MVLLFIGFIPLPSGIIESDYIRSNIWETYHGSDNLLHSLEKQQNMSKRKVHETVYYSFHF